MSQETFAARLKYAMDKAELKQADLAEKSGAPRSAISQYLSGKNVPSPGRLEALATATGATVAFLKGEEEPEKREKIPFIKKISPIDAAQCMGKSAQFVRNGLQRGILPFGNAVPGKGKKFDYYINPFRFREYVGAEQFDSYFG